MPTCSVLSIPVLPHLTKTCHYVFGMTILNDMKALHDAFNLDFTDDWIVKIFLCACLWWEGYSDILPILKLGLSSCSAQMSFTYLGLGLLGKTKCGIWSH